MECLKDEFYPFKSASRLFQGMLIDEQEFHLKDVRFSGQDKI